MCGLFVSFFYRSYKTFILSPGIKIFLLRLRSLVCVKIFFNNLSPVLSGLPALKKQVHPELETKQRTQITDNGMVVAVRV